MPAKNATTESGGFSAEERAAMKQRAAELRAEGNKGAKKADGLQAVLDSIAGMAPEDRALAERVHVTVTAAAPGLSPKTWYGMPAYANADGKVVVFFQNAGKFNYRYSTLGFQDAANLDDGDVWPVSYALKKWSPMVEKKVAELVTAAISRPPRDGEPHQSTREGATFAATQSRQNSLPSMSCITRHDSLSSSAGRSRTRTAPSGTSREHSASSAARRSSPTSPVPTRTSRCSRFLTTLPSGTRWKNNRGPEPEGSTHANAEPCCSGGSARS